MRINIGLVYIILIINLLSLIDCYVLVYYTRTFCILITRYNFILCGCIVLIIMHNLMITSNNGKFSMVKFVEFSCTNYYKI